MQHYCCIYHRKTLPYATFSAPNRKKVAEIAKKPELGVGILWLGWWLGRSEAFGLDVRSELTGLSRLVAGGIQSSV